ncbi:Double homeobox protein A, partial [Cricetulus griseus]
TLGPRDEEYSLEQQEQLKQYFELKPYPDLRARRYLATTLHLTEEQVQTWFLQRYVEKGMQPPPIQLTASPATLGPRDEEYSLEQQEQLKQYFELKPYPDLRARRYLATTLHLTEEQVQTWFLQRYVEKGMQPPPIQLTACGNSCPCAYYGLQGHRLRRTLGGTPSWRNRVLPINPSEPSTSCKHFY